MLANLAACALCSAAWGALCTAAVGRRLWRHHAVRLVALANADPLTGLPNRRVIDRWAYPVVTGAWVAYVDVDRFKCVNDHHGHAAGDRLLQVVANLLRASVRPGDLVVRMGGDEFVLVLADCTLAEAVAVVDRVQQGLSGGVLGCTLSVGLCEVPTRSGLHDEVPLREVVGAADAALGVAKRRGRGSVVVGAGPVEGQVPSPAYNPALSPAVGSGEGRCRRR